ncbi:MAG: hypothetical protein ABI203_03410 [Mucilaginibacter sp.]
MTNYYLITFLNALKTDLLNSLQANGKIATGQTAQQITIEDDGDTAQLQVPRYMSLLETGRGPTSQNALPGNPPMIERIKQWCQARGIPDKAAWTIKKSLDKKGYPGIAGILSGPLGDENIDLRLNQQTGQMADAIAQNIAEQIGLV